MLREREGEREGGRGNKRRLGVPEQHLDWKTSLLKHKATPKTKDKLCLPP